MSEKMLVTQALDERDLLVKKIGDKIAKIQVVDTKKRNDCMFGIVKTTHESKFGDVQRMSYQMVNALTEGIMPNVVSPSVMYINKLKTDDYIFLEYLKKNANFCNDFDVLVAIAEKKITCRSEKHLMMYLQCVRKNYSLAS